MGFCFMGNDTGQGCLSGAGRPPEDHREKPVFFNGAPKEAAWAQEVRLPDEFVESPGTHLICQGTEIDVGIFLIKEIHNNHSSLI
jgi:hypothetical protein